MPRFRSLPKFPLLGNLLRGPTLPLAVFVQAVPAELRVQPGYPTYPSNATNPGTIILTVSIYVPKLTDVRAFKQAGTTDFIELPAGSGRFYNVVAVEDVAKGFANEFRCCWCQQLAQPIPLP